MYPFCAQRVVLRHIVGKGLADHLEVPLPYLLYRVNTRFQEELRGIRDIGILSPTTTSPPKGFNFPTGDRATAVPPKMTGSTRLSSSRLTTPLSVRARLTSLGNNTPRPRKAASSSTLTLQATRKPFSPLRPTSPSSSEGGTDSDEDAIKEEEAERNAEDEEALSRKIEELQKMMTTETLGLVSGTRSNNKGKAKDRGRSEPLSPRSLGSSRLDSLSGRSMSQSISSAGSPHGSGSIPDIPSQSSESQPHSPIGRGLSSKSSSPPAVSSRSAVGLVHRRRERPTDFGSSHGSEASSFSDLSGMFYLLPPSRKFSSEIYLDASISASVLESALLSNIGNNGSRL